MTTINSYGIGAGTSISRQIDDDDERNRQELRRKRKVELAAEQDFARRLAAERVQHTAQVSAASQQWQAPSGSSGSKKVSTNAARREISDRDRVAIENSDQRQTHLATESEMMASPQIAPMQPEAEDSVPQRLASIIQSLSGLSLRAKEERVASQLEDLLARFRSTENVTTSSEEISEVTGYLEFIAGYFEVKQSSQTPARKILDTVQGLQEQMAQISEALRIAATGQLPGALQPSIYSASIRSMYLQKHGINDSQAIDKGMKRNDIESEDGSSNSSVLASQTPSENAATRRPEPGSRDRSSQDRDTEKRKDETLIGVTLRSV